MNFNKSGIVMARGGGNLHMSLYRDVPLFWVLFGVAPGLLGTFLGYSRIFGYHFLAIPGFLGIIFWQNLISF